MAELWLWKMRSGQTTALPDVTGWDVVATDGEIGKIDEATYDEQSGHVVVDTGWWILGKKRMIPAGVITRLDPDDKKVHVSMSKDGIKNAPDYDEVKRYNEDSRRELEDYYGKTRQRA